MLTFNSAYYLAKNPEVAEAINNGTVSDALSHFQTYGFNEGRDPNIYFDISYYLGQNADVAAAGINAFDHFNQFGQSENRNPNAAFDAQYYLAQNSDVAAANIPAFEHFTQFGNAEGRAPNSYFNAAEYLTANPDVAAAGVNAFDHFVEFGLAEGKAASQSLANQLGSGFDETTYLSNNTDVADAVQKGVMVSGYSHWLLFGGAEGRAAQNKEGQTLTPVASSSASQITGTVTDGKVSGATVGIDLDGDGVIGPDEPSVTTDEQGNFVFPSGTPTGALIATGGTDISTGLPFDGKMEAPAGSTVVNPLTTVIKKIADADTDTTKTPEQKAADAQTKLKGLLGLDDIGADITQVDFVTESTEGDTNDSSDGVSDADAGKLYSASIQLLNIVDQGKAAITGANGAITTEAAADAVFASLAERFQQQEDGAPIDLTITSGNENDTDDFLINVIKDAAVSTLSEEDRGIVDQIADNAAELVASANKQINDRAALLQDGDVGDTIEQFLVQAVQTQKFVQDTGSTRIREAAGSDDPNAAGDIFAGEFLDDTGAGFSEEFFDTITEIVIGDVNGDGNIDAPIDLPDEDPILPPVGGGGNGGSGGGNSGGGSTSTAPTEGDDDITGTANADTIDALGGNDSINGLAGDDTINAGEGDDEITISALGDDAIILGMGDDSIEILELENSQYNYPVIRYDQETGNGAIAVEYTNQVLFTITDTFGDTDTVSFTRLQGQTNNDYAEFDLSVYGTAGDDTFDVANPDPGDENDQFYAAFWINPGEGDDTINGGAEWDAISYHTEHEGVTRAADTGIIVTYSATNGGNGSIVDGLGGTDVFNTLIDSISGSQYGDTFTSSTHHSSRMKGFQGDDTFDGTNGTRDEVDYRSEGRTAQNGVTINLANSTATDPFGDTDTLTMIERVRGTNYDDSITGSSAAERLRSVDGNDTIITGGGDDTVDAGSGDDTITINADSSYVIAGAGDDTLEVKSNGFSQFVGGSGDDTIRIFEDDNAIDITIRYDQESGGGGITALLSSQLAFTVTDTYGDTDTIEFVRSNGAGDTDAGDFLPQIFGTNGDDTFGVVNPDPSDGLDDFFAEATFRPLGGDDTIRGSDEFETLSYVNDTLGPNGTEGIVVTYAATVNDLGTIDDAFGGTDSFDVNIDVIAGTAFDDSFTSTAASSGRMRGYQGDDTFDGRLGSQDFVDYRSEGDFSVATQAVNINLANETATDPFGNTDTLQGIEAVRGTNGNDTIVGSSADERIRGSNGDDTITGAGGRDRIEGESGADTIIINAGDSGATFETADQIRGFTTAEDRLDISTGAGTAANFASADGAGNTVITDLTTDATTAFTNGDLYYFEYNFGGTGDGYLVVDTDSSGAFNTGDMIIELTGANADSFLVHSDII